MKAFVDTEVTKDELIASLEAHREADRIIQGRYWSGGKGCAYGCAVHDFRPGSESDHRAAESLFGVPSIVAELGETIHEGLPSEDAKDWPLRWFRAIRPGADLSRVGPAVLYHIVQRRRDAMADLDDIIDDVRDEIGASMDRVLDVLSTWRDTGKVDLESARSAVRSAGGSAWSAVRSGEYQWMARILVEEIENAPPHCPSSLWR